MEQMDHREAEIEHVESVRRQRDPGVELRRIFEDLDDYERGGECDGHRQTAWDGTPLVPTRRRHRLRDRPGAGDQEHSIEKAEAPIERQLRGVEQVDLGGAVDDVSNEEGAEHQELGNYEDPDVRIA